MTIDRYTKVMLTIIAFCLTVNAVRETPIVKKAFAQGQAHVYIDGVSSYALQYAGPMSVRCDNCK